MKPLLKKIAKSILIIIIILFTITYLNKENNYQTSEYIIPDEAIKRFEEDLRNGIEIDPTNYLTPKKDYNNKLSSIGLKVSSTIEKVVNKVLKKLLDSITS